MKKSLATAYRSHVCGELQKDLVGKSVLLIGWVHRRRDLGGLIFIDLRDRSGLAQIIVEPKLFHSEIRSECVVQIHGVVRERPQGMSNAQLKTGECEVVASKIEVISQSAPLPFDINLESEVNESLKLKYRYLDLRRGSLQKNLNMRHQMLIQMRKHLESHHFTEVETPLLYKSTPEGARDFIVPCRIQPQRFYALPQSPQTLKQLLMMSGIERYYQIARCFRDEDLRADRQPEFSQLDIEVSFMDQETFFGIFEELVQTLWKELLGIHLALPFPRITYRDAILRYGVDKPDCRFGCEIQELTDLLQSTQFEIFKKVLQAPITQDFLAKKGSIQAIKVTGKASFFSRKLLDELALIAQKSGAQGLLWLKVQDEGITGSSLPSEEKACIAQFLSAKAGDLILIIAHEKSLIALQALGAVRLGVAQRLQWISESPGISVNTQEHPTAFLWVVDFPLLELDETSKQYTACHHPFTAVVPEQAQDLKDRKNLLELKAQAYDLVLNGVEVGGGSVRIHDPEMQKALFQAIQMSPEQAEKQFGFFLEALGFGTPPHRGMAFGIDRLAAILCGVGAIRDVMAFPKTNRGTCLMSDAPSAVQEEQLQEVGIQLRGAKIVKDL